MLISHKKKFVFIHNPKVAGTTVRNRLLPHCESNAYHLAGVVDHGLMDRSHLSVASWTEEIWQAYRKGYLFFGFVRDPLDRMMSAFSEFEHQHSELLSSVAGEDRSSILKLLMTKSSVLYDWRLVHFSPQWSYFGIAPDQLVPGVEIYRFEQLDSAWSHLADRLGLDPSPLGNDRPSFYREDQPSPLVASYATSLYDDDYKTFHYQPVSDASLACHEALHHTRLEVLCRNPKSPLLDLLSLDKFEKANLASGQHTVMKSAYFEFLSVRMNSAHFDRSRFLSAVRELA